MIINSGINRVICSLSDKNEKYKIFTTEEWINDWQQHDIIQDKYKYKG